MSTEIRPELSKKNEFYIPRERFLELKHFCRQYDLWQKMLTSWTNLYTKSIVNAEKLGHDVLDVTGKTAEYREKYLNKINMIQQAARLADDEIYDILLDGVTKGLSYNTMNIRRGGLPFSSEYYYSRYRKFFYILNGLRD